jgi:hypothetical protein
MVLKKLSLLKITVAVLTLFLCKACNPNTRRRLPLENSPYISCKNCKGKNVNKMENTKKETSDEYDFVSAKAQNEIKPLDLPEKKTHINNKVKSKKSSKIVYTRPKSSTTHSKYGKVKEQDLNVNSNGKTNNYVPLSDTPNKQYSSTEQQVMLEDKKSDMNNLLDRSAQIVNPTPKTSTLEKEQMITTTNQQSSAKLSDKLKELQKMAKEPAMDLPQQTQMTSTQSQTTIPQLQVQPAQPEAVEPQTVQASKESDSSKNMDNIPLSSYDIENKPIPLPH